jgi:tetratricopeptide (TPR) repeat protein
VIVAIAGLFTLTTALAVTYRSQQERRARAHFDRGQVLAGRGQSDDALDEFRAALSLERDDPEYERALAQTLVRVGQYTEAANWVAGLLSRYPTDGELNRAMARIARAEGRPSDARAYYQRAIYGEWPGNELDGRVETRFELVEFLGEAAIRDEVLAELLRLKVEVPPARTADVRRLSTLLADAGRLQDAGDVLHAARQTAPADQALLAAIREIDRTLALDPMLPGLRLRERTRRARRLLSAVLEQVNGCGPPAGAQDLATLAAALLAGRAQPDAEDAVQLATALWHAAPACRPQTSEAQAIARVLQAVADAERAET